MRGIKILNENCDPDLAKDKSLPNSSYIVTYEVDGETKYDLVITTRKVDIFDHYYDKYGKGLKDIQQSEGTMSPKLWRSQEEIKKAASKKK